MSPANLSVANRPNLPGVRAFENSVDEQIGVLLARQLCLQVEVHRSPIEALRYDSRPAGAKAGIAAAVWKEHAKLSGDAGPGFLLQAPWPQDVLQ